ncbi:MAG: iron ABC transporter permease [Anaerolineales bacterium]|nr:iron ABC transporter permease [Anaerolineales bacterium]
MKQRSVFRIALAILPLLFFGVFFFYPLASIFNLSFTTDGRFDIAALGKLFSTTFYLETLWFTTWQAVISTILTVGLALPGAYVFARYRFWGKQTIRTISTLPFVLPTVVVANAFTALLGPRGVVNGWLMDTFALESAPFDLQYTIWMILLAHVFYNYSVALRMISSFWQNLNPDLEQAAQMLGASPRRAFVTVTLPLLWPAIAAAAVLVFIFTFTSFGVILILGGPRFSTLETEIYRQAVNLFNLPVAAALSIFQILFTFGLMWFYTMTQQRMTRPLELTAAHAVAKPIQTWRERVLVGGNLLVMLTLLAMPLLALIGRSFTTENGLSLLYYRELFNNRRGSIFYVPPIEAVFNSTLFAAITMILAVILGLISALLIAQSQNTERQTQKKFLSLIPHPSSLLDPLFMLPLATSAVTLGFGFIITLNRPPLNLRDSLLMVPIAHTLVAIPFVIRSVLPAIRRIDDNLREAAAMLGAAPRRVWLEIDWPLIRRALLVGAVFAFTVSMGEFGATVFVGRPETPTMPVAIFRFLGQPGAVNYGQALAMSSILMLVCAVGFAAIERFRIGDEGEF